MDWDKWTWHSFLHFLAGNNSIHSISSCCIYKASYDWCDFYKNDTSPCNCDPPTFSPHNIGKYMSKILSTTFYIHDKISFCTSRKQKCSNLKCLLLEYFCTVYINKNTHWCSYCVQDKLCVNRFRICTFVAFVMDCSFWWMYFLCIMRMLFNNLHVWRLFR